MNQYINNKRMFPSEEEDSATEEACNITDKNYELKVDEKKKSENNNSEIKALLEIQENKFNKKIEDLNVTINDLRKEREQYFHFIDYLKRKREIDKKEIQELDSDVRFLLKEKAKDKNIIRYLLKERELDNKEKRKMESDIRFLLEKNEELTIKNKELDMKVQKLYEFIFTAKLRKLVKKLLEFIINNYNNYIIYDEEEKKLYFTDLPLILKSFETKKNDTLKSLNIFLDKILNYANKASFTIHFVRQSANEINDIIVFEKSLDFFQYFGISLNDKKILTILIPEKYYTNIDNADFEKKISELISKVCK